MVIPVSKPQVTPEEIAFRQTQFPDVKAVTTKPLLCTTCSGSVKDLVLKGKAISHPYLETLICEKCNTFYGDGNFSVDEDGSDKYCRWCGQGGTLFLCSKCSSGFCKKCVKRNLPRSALEEIENDDWTCYCCIPTPLYEHRALCWAAKEYAEKCAEQKAGSSKSKKSTRDKRSRDSSDEGGDTTSSKKAKTSRNEESTPKNGDDKSKGNSKKKRKDDPKKNEKKQDENDEVSETRRSLRERKTKEEDVLFDGVKKSQWNIMVSKFEDVANDVARMTKEIHKKMLACKAKKISFKHINSFESLNEIRANVNQMMTTMEDSSIKIRGLLNDFCDSWTEVAKKGEDFDEALFMEGKRNLASITNAILENGIFADNSKLDKMDIDEMDDSVPAEKVKEDEAKTLDKTPDKNGTSSEEQSKPESSEEKENVEPTKEKDATNDISGDEKKKEDETSSNEKIEENGQPEEPDKPEKEKLPSEVNPSKEIKSDTVTKESAPLTEKSPREITESPAS